MQILGVSPDKLGGVKNPTTRKYTEVLNRNYRDQSGSQPLGSLPQRRLGQPVRLGVIFTRNMRDGEFQRAGQLAACPMKRIKARAATNVLAGHLPHDDLRVGVNMQLVGFERNGVLQSFHERGVFGDVVVLVTDPLRDANRSTVAAVDDDPNA